MITTEHQLIQYIIDTTVGHLVNMPEQSLRDTRGCAYRGDEVNGKKQCCAVGILIDDAHYTFFLETKSATESNVRRAVAASLAAQDNIAIDAEDIEKILPLDLLSMLQNIHDDSENWRTKGFIGHDKVKHIIEKLYSTYNLPDSLEMS